MSAVKQPRIADNLCKRLRVLMCNPLEVVGQNGLQHIFMPSFGVGMVTVTAADAVPALVIDEAEQLALASERSQPGPARPAPKVEADESLGEDETVEPSWESTVH
jgi:hypothetical protein